MIPAILAVVNELVPYVAQIIRDHHAQTGQLPTDEEIVAKLHADVLKFTTEGEAWLATHPKQE